MLYAVKLLVKGSYFFFFFREVQYARGTIWFKKSQKLNLVKVKVFQNSMILVLTLHCTSISEFNICLEGSPIVSYVYSFH